MGVDIQANNTTIKNVTLIDDAPGVGYHVKVYNLDGLKLENVAMSGTSRSTGVRRGGLDLNSVKNSVVKDVAIEGYYKNGYAITSVCDTTNSSSNAVVDTVAIKNVGWNGFAFQLSSGPSCASTGSVITGVEFKGINSVTNVGQLGIRIEGNSGLGIYSPTNGPVDLGSFTFTGPFGYGYIGNVQNNNLIALQASFDGVSNLLQTSSGTDTVESKLYHDCVASPYGHGVCSGDNGDTVSGNDLPVSYGSVQYITPLSKPINLGWNLRSKSALPGDRAVDLACGDTTNGDYPEYNDGKVAHNWSTTDTISGLHFQRQWMVPASGEWTTDSAVYSTDHTDFSTFDSALGVEGTWNSRVRSWLDMNGNNTFDEKTDIASDWSNECKVTYDRSKLACTASTVKVSNLQPQWDSVGGEGVWSAYYAPDSHSPGISPGTTAIYDGRDAGIIKAGLTISSDGHYWDEGLLAFKLDPSVGIANFASQALTFDVENETGANPVWVRIRLVSGALYQFVPTTNPAGWHTVNAAAGNWYLMNNGNATGPARTFTEIAGDNPGTSVDRVYLTLGMGDSYHGTGSGTIAWVDKVKIGCVTYDFIKDPTTISKSDVTVCKNDPSGAGLAGWQVLLHNSAPVETVNVPSESGLAVSSSVLPAGDYVLRAKGQYTYRPGTLGAEYSDAGWSKRAPSDSMYGGAFAPWVKVSTSPAPHNGWLGVKVDGDTADWGSYFNPAHIYAKSYAGYAGGAISMQILDDVYSDNSGSVAVDILKGYTGITGKNGCITFSGVTYGDYQLGEIDQSGWNYTSGSGPVTIDAATESFNLVNTAVPTITSAPTATPTSAPFCGDGIKNAQEQCDGTSDCQSNCILKPVVTIVPAMTKIIAGQACGVGSAWDDDGLKVNVANWSSGYKLMGRYFNAGGGFVAWADMQNYGALTVTGSNAQLIAMNTGNSPAGSAGWEVKVINAGGNDISNTDALNYTINTDSTSKVCGGVEIWWYKVESYKDTLGAASPLAANGTWTAEVKDSNGLSVGAVSNTNVGTSYAFNQAGPYNNIKLAHGVYTFEENGKSGYEFSWGRCMDATVSLPVNSGYYFDVGADAGKQQVFGPDVDKLTQDGTPWSTSKNSGATLNLSAGTRIYCVLYNQPMGTITVDKVTNPADDQTTFDFTLSKATKMVDTFGLKDTDTPHSLNVISGTYSLSEASVAGWDKTSATCSDGSSINAINISAGENITCTFTNTKRGSITVVKKTTQDDGTFNFTLTGGSNLPESFDLITQKTTQSKTFDNILPGTYSLTENGSTGWTLTGAVCTGENTNNDSDESLTPTPTPNATHSFTVEPGKEVMCTYTNDHKNSVISLAKLNDTWPNDKSPGDEVHYKMKLKVSENDIKGLWVTDLLPNGFKYKPGSWSATRNGVPFSIDEPVYHSPGKWNVGDAAINDEIVLSYTATVDPSVKPGLYKDLAWAYGCEFNTDCSLTSPDKLLATSVDAGVLDPGVVTDRFVGTKVAINQETQNTSSTDIKKVEKKDSNGDVLGASTSNLPGTGSETIWLYIMSLLSGFGIISILMGLLLKKRMLKKAVLAAVGLMLAVSIFAVGKPVLADAPSNLSIRISEPKTPTNSLFNLIFVTLDLEGRDLTVKCYKKSPSDGGYSQFGSDISLLTTGGNTGECPISESFLSQKGTYNFYTTVDAAGEGPVQSQIVAVDYNNSEGPSTPTNYAKDHISSCQYKISFKTADDSGKTVKVEVYRNENTDFGLNSSTRVGTVNIASNSDGSYTDSVPDCNKTYYYVIRAFDTFGNGSGSIGDSVVTVTSSSTSTTTTSTTSTTEAAGGAIPVEGANVPAGEEAVLGEQTTITPGATTSAGQVLGEMVPPKEKTAMEKVLGAVTSKNMRPWYIAAVVLAIALIGYVIYRKRQNGPQV